ncbi:DNA methyltransferase [Thiolapillus sp.]|uniref:DNA methyltransferase n=1 Tax=Thiolapillus sp. TaxID=2017437 RepID=UPI003AF98B4B
MLLRTWLPYDWTPRSEAYFVFPLAQGTPGKQCGLAATGVYQPSLRSPWLAAMVPRLELLRELLAEDGSIWVSIDDNEGHYLKVIMDEVFGRGNFISSIIWRN